MWFESRVFGTTMQRRCCWRLRVPGRKQGKLAHIRKHTPAWANGSRRVHLATLSVMDEPLEVGYMEEGNVHKRQFFNFGGGAFCADANHNLDMRWVLHEVPYFCESRLYVFFRHAVGGEALLPKN